MVRPLLISFETGKSRFLWFKLIQIVHWRRSDIGLKVVTGFTFEKSANLRKRFSEQIHLRQRFLHRRVLFLFLSEAR